MSDDEQAGPSYEQMVEMTITEVIKRGMFERVDTVLRGKTDMSDDDITMLVEHAQLRMVSSAPEPIRGSLPTVISYHRWNDIYQKSSSVEDRIAAQKQIDRLMGSIH